MKKFAAFGVAVATWFGVIVFQGCGSGGLPPAAQQFEAGTSASTAVTPPAVTPTPVPTPVPVVAPTITNSSTFGVAFGGMYSTGMSAGDPNYNNFTTGALTCPTGYTATQILGADGIDNLLFVCTKPLPSNVLPDYDYGGLYANSASATGYLNPSTGTQGCQASFTVVPVLSETNVDHKMFYCIRAHKPDPTGSLQFAGFYGQGDSNTTYPNPLTNASTCPPGATSFKTYGDPSFDFPIYGCYGAALTAVQ